MLSGNCTEALSRQANVTISCSSAKLIKVLRESYHIAYIQHAPMEPRAAAAEWTDGHLTVWTGTQQPGRVRDELARALRVPRERVRVIVPDTGGGFGGKHSGEGALEAARLALAAKKSSPVPISGLPE